jgi:hypothetical protein
LEQRVARLQFFAFAHQALGGDARTLAGLELVGQVDTIGEELKLFAFPS